MVGLRTAWLGGIALLVGGVLGVALGVSGRLHEAGTALAIVGALGAIAGSVLLGCAVQATVRMRRLRR